ncbi:RPM1 interacting protein 13, putative isoform 2 [Hibiscus syriacus]|uniref:RPM1 interacting protein 13, putative isoform 2 n=1 Tax=Hibiscus syriacus TaxID=106335 RepID=A0A6A3AD39_HIBSY|nr:RPM1 interacting protein 13, putative isoform 2 [Hibiscus syriacus]
MGSNPVVFDISSDEEDVASALEESKGDDYDWFSEVLKTVNKGFDDSDEVVLIGEVNLNKKSKSRNTSVRENVNVEDDDCIILEDDPETVVSDVNDNHEDSDELLVVGQKGQVACRDFPHPRHDCAKYPFRSTSHEQHCELCHCFVCDMQAPCCYWGSGISSSDHCHATDKEEIWKTLRKNFRLGRNVSAPPVTSDSTAVPQQAPRRDIIRLTTQNHVFRSAPAVTSHSTVVSQRDQVPHWDNIRVTTQSHVFRPTPVQASGNCIPQDHASRPSIIRACSSSTRHGIPYNPIVGSRHRHVLNKSTIQPHLGSQEVLGVHNTVIRRDRGIKIRNWGSQFNPSNIMSKGVDTEVTSTRNCIPYVPSENITYAHASQFRQNPALVTTSNERNPDPIDWKKDCFDTSLGTYTHQISQPSMDSVFTNSAPSLSSANIEFVPQSNVREDSNHVQNLNRSATHNGFSDFDISWVNDIGRSNQQPSADYLQFQTTTGEGPFNVGEGDKSFYNELESFLSDSHCPLQGPLTAGLNAPPPPNHISLDTGMLFFDIESFWDCLTRA